VCLTPKNGCKCLIDKHSQPDVTIRDAEVAGSSPVSPITENLKSQVEKLNFISLKWPIT